MKAIRIHICAALLLGLSSQLFAQAGFTFPGNEREAAEVPLMLPAEKEVIDRQSERFNKALEPILAEAAKSTVSVWGKEGNRRPRSLAYATVIGNGTQFLTKWSEIEKYSGLLYVNSGEGKAARVMVAGVFSDEDLALLEIAENEEDVSFVPASFFPTDLSLGRFLTAVRPNGKPAGFGVVGVLDRNLNETDQAHLGIMADVDYHGDGVRIANVQSEFGAAKAGLRAGDLILMVDDRKISGLFELKNALSLKQPGDIAKIQVDTAGAERSVDVMLSNRPVTGQFAGDRLGQMERMGGEPNRVRSGFSRVVQSDMKIEHQYMGGPVVDLQGRVVGITMARAGRTRTYIMTSEAVMDLLKTKYETVAEAELKSQERKDQLAAQNRQFFPNTDSAPKPRSKRQMGRNLGDLRRLSGRLQDEMEVLEQP